MRIKKQRGVSLLELMCVMGVAASLLIGTITLLSESRSTKKNLNLSQGITALPLSSLEACLEINGEIKFGRSTQYKSFKRDCHSIWSGASRYVTEDIAKHSQMIGVTVFYGRRNELYLPILEKDSGILYYPGGAEATLETKKLSMKEIESLNESLASINK